MTWIDVKDRLPLPGQKVLRFIQFNEATEMDVGELVSKRGLRWNANLVTHWIPLPDPPSKAEE